LTFVENGNTSIDQTVSDLAAGVGVVLNQANGNDIGIVNLGLADASGSEDVLNVTTKLTSGHGAESIEDIAFTNIETLNITSTKLGTLATVASDINTIADISSDTTLTKITLAGETNATITLGSEVTNLATIDASTFTGDLNLTVGAVADNAITTNSGDDTIAMATTLTNADTIIGGSHGSAATSGDTLTATINGLTATTGALNISQVESVHLNTATAASTLDLTGVVGANIVAFADAQNVTVTGLAADTKLGMSFSNAGEYSGTLTATLADVTGTTDNLIIQAGDSDADDDVDATLDIAATIETTTLTIESDNDGTDSATFNVTNVDSANLVVNHTLTTGVSATNVLATDTVTLGTLSTTTTNLDATGFAGIVSATASATGTTFGLTGGIIHDVTGAAGNDTFNIGTSDTGVAPNIDGGTGTDTANIIMGSQTITDTNVDNFDVINYTVGASKNAIVATASTKGINDEATKVTVSGGNSLSTYKSGHATIIGAAAGGQATSLITYDLSGFAGDTLALFGDSVVDTDLTITGGAGTNKVIATYEAATTEVIKISAVENVFLGVDNDGTDGVAMIFDAAALTGAEVLAFSAGAANTDDTNSISVTNLAAGVKIGIGWADVGTGNLQHTQDGEFFGGITLTTTLASNSGTTDALTYQLNDSNAAADTVTLSAAGIEAVTLEVRDAAEAHTVNLDAVAATAGSTQTITVTGGRAGNALTIAQVDATNTGIDASAFLGDLTITDRSSVATSITTAAGADAVKHEHASDIIDTGAGLDTLTVDFQAIGELMRVDLSATAGTDMVTVGGAAGTLQTNFEHANLASFVGSGTNITGSSIANTLTGTSTASDSINPGLGADTVTGGGGVDYINITEVTSSTDIVVLGDSTDANNYDQITGFVSATDDIRALQSVHGWNSTDGTTTVLLATGATIKAADLAGDSNIQTISANISTNTYITYLAGTSTYTQLEAACITAVGLTGAMDAAAVALVAVDDGTHTGLWQFTSGDTVDNAATAAELELIGILKDVNDATALVVGDFLFT
jgi:hypothetical protein